MSASQKSPGCGQSAGTVHTAFDSAQRDPATHCKLLVQLLPPTVQVWPVVAGSLLTTVPGSMVSVAPSRTKITFVRKYSLSEVHRVSVVMSVETLIVAA
jgi:hypothetical protein